MIRITTFVRLMTLAAAVLLWPAVSPAQTPATPPPPVEDHSAHQAPTPTAEDHSMHQAPTSQELPAFIPPVTDEMRTAAFPDVHGHSAHDNVVNYLVLFDQLEWQSGGQDAGANWDTKGWIGRDRDRFWFRTEGRVDQRRVEDAQAQLLYGRSMSRWWDVVAGVRHDVRPGPSRTWAAVGVQGLAPYWFEVEATAYLGTGGRTHFRFETEYDLLLTNLLVLQPSVELELHGKSDPERGIGAGLSTADVGLRLRYHMRREFAPYVGLAWHRILFGTGEAARADGRRTGGARLALGLRLSL